MVNYTPNIFKDVKKSKTQEILVKDIMLKVFPSFTEDMDIDEASKTLIKKKISGAPVINDKNEAVGFLSEKDVLKLEMDMKYHNDQPRKVRDYMSKKIIQVQPNSDIHEAIELFTKYNFYCYPVVDNNKVVGLVYRRSVLKAVCKMVQASWK